jgi:hypothetical protein
MTNLPAGFFIGRAYAIAPIDMAGLPPWAMSERYDLSATSSLEKATAEERASMMRAMRKDGTLGRGPDLAPAPDTPPSVFVALPEQLGLKLEPSRTIADTLVLDRLEPPTGN